MTGSQLKAAREKLAVTPDALAAKAGLSVDALAHWENTEVPANEAARIDWLLWELERDKALADSGLPECDWMNWWNARPASADGLQNTPTADEHVASCSACQARMQYVKDHVRPAPLGTAPADRLLAHVPGWLWAAIAGAAIILIAGGGSGAASLLMDGRPLDAAMVVLLCILAGAAAGLVYHFTRPLHQHFLGVHLAWMLVGATYVFAALICNNWIAGMMDTAELDTHSDSGFYLYPFFAAVAVLGGLGFGYGEQWDWHKNKKRPFRLLEWLLPALAAFAALQLIVGSTAIMLSRRDQPLATEAAAEPQVLTLRELIDKGFGKNRHVLVKEFRLCDADVLASAITDNLTGHWLPVVPDATEKAGRASVPPKVQAIIYDTRFTNTINDPLDALKLRRLQNIQRESIEIAGYKGVVVNGVKELGGKARRDLQKLAPQTDFAKLLIIDRWTRPVTSEYVNGCMSIGIAVAAAGAVLLAVVAASGFRMRRSTLPQ